MARIEFDPASGIEHLSGTYGYLTYRTAFGKNFVHSKPIPVLPKNPTRKQRALYKKQCIVNECVRILQEYVGDIQEAIRLRPLIRQRIMKLYNKYQPTIKAPTKLQKAIMTEYYQKFGKTSTGV